MSDHILRAVALFLFWFTLSTAVMRYSEHPLDVMIGMLIGMTVSFSIDFLFMRHRVKREAQLMAQMLAESLTEEMRKRGHGPGIAEVGMRDADGEMHVGVKKDDGPPE